VDQWQAVAKMAVKIKIPAFIYQPRDYWFLKTYAGLCYISVTKQQDAGWSDANEPCVGFTGRVLSHTDDPRFVRKVTSACVLGDEFTCFTVCLLGSVHKASYSSISVSKYEHVSLTGGGVEGPHTGTSVRTLISLRVTKKRLY
jgi:hypothetical protein